MKDISNRTSPRRILNILEEIIVDPDNFTAKKISHKLKIKVMLSMMRNGLMEWLVFQCQYLILKKNYVFVCRPILPKVEKI